MKDMPQATAPAWLIHQAARELAQGRRVCIATVVSSGLGAPPAGSAWLVREDGSAQFCPAAHRAGGSGRDEPASLAAAVADQARRLLNHARQRPPGRAAGPRDRMAHLVWPQPQPPSGPDGGPQAAGRTRVFLELLEPPPRLLVVGAGQDAPPLCRLAAEAGFEVRRATYANSLLLPVAIVKFRLWEPLVQAPAASGVRLGPPWMERLLLALLEAEAWWIGLGGSFPLGQSALVLAQRRSNGVSGARRGRAARQQR